MRQRHDLIIAQFGDGLPWNPAHYEAEIRHEISRGCEAFVRAGRRLVVARECAGHGEWAEMLSRIGLAPRVAQRMMEAARRIESLPSGSAPKLLQAAGSTSKLIELLALPDDQFAELAVDGETSDIDMQDLSKLTVSELRQRIRELKEDLAAKDERAAKREREIEKKEAALRKLNRQLKEAPVDERIERLRNAVNRCAIGITAKISAYEESPKAEPVDSLKTHMLALVDESDPEVAQGDHRAFMAGVIDDLIHELRLLRDHELLDLQQVKARKH